MRRDKLIAWIDQHVELARHCERGGWPDGSTLSMNICSQKGPEWIVNLCFVEVIQEMSECEPTRTKRCGKFVIRFDSSGAPESMRLIRPM